jgi:hypothetical protein
MSDEDADERAERLDRKAEAERRDWRETKRLRAEGTGARAWRQRMKVQVRDIDTWALLAEADLTGKKFTVVDDRFVNDEEISMTVIADGTAMPDAFLVDERGRVIRLVSFDSLVTNIRQGYTIIIPAGDLKWGR